MASAAAITTLNLPSLKKLASGKVRDLFELDADTLLFTASDRISAYDVVLNNGVPGKGFVLTQISAHWFSVLSKRIPSLKHHLVSLTPPASAGLTPEEQTLVRGRSMVCRRLKVFPLEAIVRGYITGSAWAEYSKHGTVHGIPQPAGLQPCSPFPGGPIYTPSTKAEQGDKDINISPAQAAEIVGQKYADRIAELSLLVYKEAADYARERGIIVADTKFEFALDEATDEVVLVDEVLTPDSSRFWDASQWQPGHEAPSYDKQYVRDYLTNSGLKGKPNVVLPEEVVNETTKKYRDVFQKLTGRSYEETLQALEG
ncbi:SAICAR synthase-like protein [Mariannaea sp. PMI_226]|nr:SAICAR synthase-like protein [Mariannaea sp. PMI_226]